MKSDVHFGAELHSRRKTMRGFHIPIWRKMTAKIKKVKMPDLSLQVKIMLYIAALACAVLSIVSITCGGIFPPAAEYAVYTAAGVTLFLSCFYLAGDLDLLKQKIMELARSNTLTARLTDDIEYRSVLFAVCGVCMNIVFALFNGIAGWMSRSAWFGTLSAYYLILGMMRAYWIFHNQDKVRNRENQRSSRAPERNIWRCYGVLFLFLAVVLCGAGSLYVNPEHTACVAEGPDFPDVFKPVASAQAKAAGMSAATLYVYYDNKEDMFRKVYMDVKKHMTEKCSRDIDPEGSVEEAVRKLCGNLLDYMQEYTDEFLFIEQACNSPMTTDEMLETLEQYNKDTVRIFQRGIEEGILKPASPALLISFCYYPIQQIFKEWRKDRSMLPDVDFDMVFQMCWDAVKR